MSQLKMSKYYFQHDFSMFEDFIISQPCVHKLYRAGEIISSQSETLRYGYYIKNGVMKLSIGHECGNEKTLALFGPGSLFPLGINHHHYEMEYAMAEEAFTEVEAYEFDYLAIREMFLSNQDLGIRMMEHYCDFSSFLFFEISSLSNDNSLSKVCNIIFALTKTSFFSNQILQFSQEDMTELSGFSKIQVARIYQQLRAEGIISTTRGGLKILDSEKLLQFCSHEVK